MTSSRIVTCRSCSNEGQHGSRGWCAACTHRWYRAGRPDTGPPPPQRTAEAAWAARRAGRAARIQDYLFVLATEPGISRAGVAARMGVSTRTIARWESSLRAQHQADHVAGAFEQIDENMAA